MMNIKNLIQILPYYFKDKDTYKDKDGKGILERYLDICGNYFKIEIEQPLDTFLDVIDIDSPASDIYLNFIWEFLGYIPYAYGSLTVEENWAKYNNNVTNQIIWKTSLDKEVPRARKDILKYAITLYKIRGTLDFYNILLGFYGLSCTIEDPSGDKEHPHGTEPTVVGAFNLPYFDDSLNFDSNVTFDLTSDCNSCAEVKLVITVPSNLPGIDLNKGTIDKAIANRIFLLLNRFRPINVVDFSNSNVKFNLTEVKGLPYILPLTLV